MESPSRISLPCPDSSWAASSAVRSGGGLSLASRSVTSCSASPRTIAPHSCSLQVCALRLPAPWLSLGCSAAQRRPLVPQARDIKPICILSLFQTIGQYFFFYLGLSRASAMSSSIIEASANFLAILFAALAFRTEKLNTAKVFGCVLGFAGVALVNLSGADGTFGFTLDGEGFILASTVAGALSTCLIGIFSREHDGVLLAGWQFLVGGLALTAIGFLMGGALSPTEIAPAIALIIYMALISAVAYCAVVAPSCRQPRQPASRSLGL